MRLFILVLCMASQLAAVGGDATMTANDYWQLTKARLQLSTIEWQERIASAEKANGDRKYLIAGSEAITKQFAAHHSALHSKFGTTPQEYLRFGTDHARELSSWLELEENRNVKQDIEDLRAQVEGLTHRFDALAGPMLGGVK